MVMTAGIHHPSWVYVNLTPGHPSSNRFASCYRCGALCQPDRDDGLADNAVALQEFADKHCACRAIRRG